MSNSLMVKPVEFEVNGEKVTLTGNTVKNYLVRGNGDVSDQELVMFINLCKFQKLNPFLNEAYLVKFGSQPAQIIVSKEAFMKRAENHPKYEGFEAGIIVEREGQLVEIEGAIKLETDKLIGGWCKVYRGDRKREIVSKISLDEFSKSQATWKQMPLNMIRKTAIVNGLREAFPESLNNMYTEEEAQIKPIEEEVVEREIRKSANSEIIDVEIEEVPEKPNKTESEKDSQPLDQQEPVVFEQEDMDFGFDEGPGF
ncbi:phage recombination protein Bet [Mycobacteroides abscessus]|uniref:phage recombination protein Bet n=1 Tax=Mycobacteroides abscessus TaxID=36809 RepID=UPI000C25B6B7